MQLSVKHKCVDGWPGVFWEGGTRCGMCGDPLVRYDVSPKAILLAIPSQGMPVPGSLLLSASRSLFDADLELSFNGSVIAIDGRTTSPVRVSVPADGHLKVTVALAGDSLPPADSRSEWITIKRKDAALSSQNVEVRIGRLPQIHASELTFSNAIANMTAEAIGHVQHPGGLEVKIVNTYFEPELEGLTVSGLWSGQALFSGAEARFSVAAANLSPSGVRSTLVVNFDLGLAPLRIDVQIKPENAELRWSRPHTIFVGIDNELTLTVSNSGREPVEVERLAIVNQPDWLKIKGVKLPLLVPPGGERTWRVRVEGAHSDLLELESRSIELTAVISLSRMGERRSKHTVWVKAAKSVESWVGVDFGTTSSCVAYWESRDKGVDGTVRMLDFGGEQHSTTVPSVAYFDERSGKWLGGLEALEMAEELGDKDNLVGSVKRLLNHPPNSPDRTILRANREFEPEEPATAILFYLRAKAEERLQVKLQNVVLTHPANFSDTGIKALLRCAEAAGLKPAPDTDGFEDEELMEENFGEDASHEDKIRYRLDEPVAVAIHATELGLIGRQETELVLVYDFGGGTLDVSLLEVVNRQDDWHITVLSHRGANWLGGDDFTKRLVVLAAERIAKADGNALQYDREELCKDDRWDRMSDEERIEVQRNWRLLWDAAEEAKVRLSSNDSAKLNVSLSRNGKTVSLDATITATEFETAVEDLVERSLGVVKLAVESVVPPRRVHLDDVDVVIASGKTSRVPVVRRRLKELCGAEKVERVKEGAAGGKVFDVKECVAQGACNRCHDSVTPLGQDAVGLKVFGLHQRTNCSYGIAKTTGVGAMREVVFQPLIREGVTYEDAKLKVTGTVRARGGPGRQRIPLYQHTGNTRSPEALVIAGNADVTFIDDIEVKMPPRNLEGKIQISMWLGRDGLLEAEASAEGSADVFRPKLAKRHTNGPLDAAR